VELKDSRFLIWDAHQTVSHNFISVGTVVSQNIRSINPSAYFQCQFRLTNRVIEYERVIYSFFDLAGDVGGFIEFSHVFIFILVGGFANRMFYAEIIKDLFKVRLDTAPSQHYTELAKCHKQLKKARKKKHLRSKSNLQTPPPLKRLKSHGVERNKQIPSP